jgi:hypothetical protein
MSMPKSMSMPIPSPMSTTPMSIARSPSGSMPMSSVHHVVQHAQHLDLVHPLRDDRGAPLLSLRRLHSGLSVCLGVIGSAPRSVCLNAVLYRLCLSSVLRYLRSALSAHGDRMLSPRRREDLPKDRLHRRVTINGGTTPADTGASRPLLMRLALELISRARPRTRCRDTEQAKGGPGGRKIIDDSLGRSFDTTRPLPPHASLGSAAPADGLQKIGRYADSVYVFATGAASKVINEEMTPDAHPHSVPRRRYCAWRTGRHGPRFLGC